LHPVQSTPSMLQARAGRLSSVFFPFSVYQPILDLPEVASLAGDPASTFLPPLRVYEPLSP